MGGMGGGGREVQEGGDIHIHIADSLRCKATIPQLKKEKKKKEKKKVRNMVLGHLKPDTQ